MQALGLSRGTKQLKDSGRPVRPTTLWAAITDDVNNLSHKTSSYSHTYAEPFVSLRAQSYTPRDLEILGTTLTISAR